MQSQEISTLRVAVRLTRAFFNEEWPKRIAAANRTATSQSLTVDDVYAHCLPYIAVFGSDIDKLEEFGLSIVEAEWTDGVTELMRIVEDWITLSERLWPGRNFHPATGAPSILALRLVANWCAKAADLTSLNIMSVLLTRPLAIIESTGKASTLPFVDRRDLFWPEAMLNYADTGVRYVKDESWKNTGMRDLFASEGDYLGGLSVFFFLAGLLYQVRQRDPNSPLYPGFKLIQGSSASIEHFLAKISSDARLIQKLAEMANLSVESFRAGWPDWIKILNDASLGGRYFTGRWAPIRLDIF
jgi:hypothetical protein